MRRALPFLFLLGCSELADVERLRCGNGLHELQAGEDCDGLPPGSPLRCGEPGTPAACLYVCADTPCPDGWSCGRDGVCRAGTGRLGPPAILSLPGYGVDLGDVDGDGRTDVICQDTAALYVAYGEGDGTLREAVGVDFTTNLSPVAVGDIDLDGRDEVVVHSSDGALIYPGRADRRLVALATPDAHPEGTPELAVAVRAKAPFRAQQLLAGWRDASGLRLELDGEPVDSGSLDLFADGPVIGQVAVADLDRADNGDELALATEGGDRVEIVRVACSPCRIQRIATVLAPRSSKITGGTFFSDLDGDGDLDLIVSVEQTRGRQVAIAWRDAGGFGLMDFEPGLRQVLTHPPMAPPGDVPILKAVADVIGDSLPELISDQAVFRLEDGIAVMAGRIVSGQPAELVLPADLDGDGRSELVVVAPAELRLYAFGEIDGFGATTLAVGAVEDLVVGDFDADGRDDFVFTTGLDGSILGSFSSRDPTTLQLVADLDPPATALAVLRTPVGTAGVAPAVFVTLADGARHRFTGRYLGLPATPIELPGRGRAAAIGRFFDGQEGALIASRGLAGRENYLFGLPAADMGLRPPQPIDDPCSTPAPFYALSRTVDFDGDGRDSLLQLNTGSSDLDRPGGIAPGQEVMPLLQSWPIYLADVVDGALQCRWAGEVTAVKAPVDLEVADLDGDGYEDIAALLLFRASGDQHGRRPGEATLAVWRGTAGDPEPSVQYDLPDRTVAATAMRLADGRRALVLSTTDQTLMAWLSDGRLVTEVLGDGPPGIQDTTAGDVDGDGLDDLVLKTPTTVMVRRQDTCTARAAWEGRCTRP